MRVREPRLLPRRRALAVPAAAAALALGLSGCDFFDLDPGEEDGGRSEADGQAPELAERVESGDLPPLQERLPENPVTVEPVEEVGNYGGTWNTATLGIGDWPWLGRTVGYENLTRWNTEWTETVPNIAEDFEYSDDATTVTYDLREGMKWSDGDDFTADDIVFAANDVFNNADLTPMANQNPPTAEKIDDYTVEITLDDPDALWAAHDFIQYQLVNKPVHYLGEFHIDHNENADELAEEEGFDSWTEMFDVKAGVTDSALTWQNPDLPTLYPWEVVEPLADSGRMVLERNPYYWKVDSAGNQLPYLDSVEFEIMQDEEVMLTRALNGDFDFHTRHFNTAENRPVLAENRESGGYEFIDLDVSEMNTNMISFNQTVDDDGLREIFRDKRFRIAMSHGINRQDIIDVVYQGQGEPWQGAPRRDTPFFNEDLAKQYTEFDLDKAGDILDDAGYGERNGDGVRVSEDGTPLSFTLSAPGDYRPDIIDSMEMVVDTWKELDVDVELDVEERSSWQDSRENNEHEVNVWSGDAGLLDAMYDPRWYAPLHSGESNFAIPWAQWYASDGADPRAQEPPQEIKDHLEMYDELQAEPDPSKREELMVDFLAESRERFYAMGIGLTQPGYGIVSTDFRNVPEQLPEASVYNTPAPANPEQFFIEQ
ncbi:ABC transporter substrate-binding protein [Streptomonospora salina]|uniref:Peptide/nickel transport system substrate-binding protein n=1 Tax=Streptomonospora salina TaxID=104205 RepID=A0A841E3V6_9ACTN|nr:ABC transporter substrate-binding protein [Streptomonospora salina]MBB5997402.1 peptide/nickel transport system substrate-binding protein [Streptomonospora salina]